MPSAPPAPASVWEDLMDIWYAPSTVFRRRENGNFGVALVVLCVAIGVLAFAGRGGMQPIMDAEFARQMVLAQKANPSMTADQVSAGKAIADKMSSIGPIFAVLFTVFAVFALGFLIWIVGKFFGSKQTLPSAFVVSTFAAFPWIAEGLFNVVQGLLIDFNGAKSRYAVTASLARFMDPDNTAPRLLSLAGRVDVFVIWWAILVAIGLKVTGKLTAGQAGLAAFIVWLLASLPGLIRG